MANFHPDNVIPSVQEFLYGDFRKWCEQISMKEFWGIDDPSLGDIESPEMAIIKTGYFKFQGLAGLLKEYVNSQVEIISDEAKDMLFSDLFSLKHRIDSIASLESISILLGKINQNASKYYVDEGEEIVVEHSGEVVTKKIFSKKVPYAYKENYYVYRLYFKVATRELRLLLNAYYQDFKKPALTEEELTLLTQKIKLEMMNDFREIIRKEKLDYKEEVGSLAYLKDNLILPLTLKVFDESTRANLRRCFDVLSYRNSFIIDTEKHVFVNIFSKEPVNIKVVWMGNKTELAYFIEGIKEDLLTIKDRWFGAVSCFKIFGEVTFERRSLIDAVAHSTEVVDKKRYWVMKDKEREAKLDLAIKRFKGKV